MTEALFSIGRLVITPTLHEWIESDESSEILNLHVTGNFGTVGSYEIYLS